MYLYNLNLLFQRKCLDPKLPNEVKKSLKRPITQVIEPQVETIDLIMSPHKKRKKASENTMNLEVKLNYSSRGLDNAVLDYIMKHPPKLILEKLEYMKTDQSPELVKPSSEMDVQVLDQEAQPSSEPEVQPLEIQSPEKEFQSSESEVQAWDLDISSQETELKSSEPEVQEWEPEDPLEISFQERDIQSSEPEVLEMDQQGEPLMNSFYELYFE